MWSTRECVPERHHYYTPLSKFWTFYIVLLRVGCVGTDLYFLNLQPIACVKQLRRFQRLFAQILTLASLLYHIVRSHKGKVWVDAIPFRERGHLVPNSFQ